MGREEMVGQTFVELADTLVEDYEVIEFLNLLAERCVLLLGVADAGVVLIDGDNLRLVASSSERMRLVELIELQRDDGPCLECCRDGGRVREDDLEGGGIGGPSSLLLRWRRVPLGLRSAAPVAAGAHRSS